MQNIFARSVMAGFIFLYSWDFCILFVDFILGIWIFVFAMYLAYPGKSRKFLPPKDRMLLFWSLLPWWLLLCFCLAALHLLSTWFFCWKSGWGQKKKFLFFSCEPDFCIFYCVFSKCKTKPSFSFSIFFFLLVFYLSQGFYRLFCFSVNLVSISIAKYESTGSDSGVLTT